MPKGAVCSYNPAPVASIHPVGTDTCSQRTYVHGSHHEFGLYCGCGATCMRAGGSSAPQRCDVCVCTVPCGWPNPKCQNEKRSSDTREQRVHEFWTNCTVHRFSCAHNTRRCNRPSSQGGAADALVGARGLCGGGWPTLNLEPSRADAVRRPESRVWPRVGGRARLANVVRACRLRTHACLDKVTSLGVERVLAPGAYTHTARARAQTPAQAPASDASLRASHSVSHGRIAWSHRIVASRRRISRAHRSVSLRKGAWSVLGRGENSPPDTGSEARRSRAALPITPVRGTAPARAAPAGPASALLSRLDPNAWPNPGPSRSACPKEGQGAARRARRCGVRTRARRDGASLALGGAACVVGGVRPACWALPAILVRAPLAWRQRRHCRRP
jgi:hypothetical protein